MLSSIDIAVALVLVDQPGEKFEELSDVLGISLSKSFDAVERLGAAGLMLPEGRRVDRLALLEFLEHGLRYVFPAKLGNVRKGVPTAHSGPILSGEIDGGGAAYVWPSSTGTARGREIEPLVPRASELPERSPRTYEMLSLVDALRVGRARERELAGRALRERFNLGEARLAL